MPTVRCCGCRTEDRKWILMRFPGNGQLGAERADEGRGGDAQPSGDSGCAGGTGRVVLFATNPCYRWQNLGEFNMLANSILHFNDFPKPVSAPVASE